MAENNGNKPGNATQLREGYQPVTVANRGHQPGKALDKGYQASNQVKPPTKTPNIGTTAVTPAAAATNTQTVAADKK
jgi:hypothetical protein